MKKLSKLTLNELSKAYMREREMNVLIGGWYCTCSCYWAGNGGSSSSSNMNANYNLGSGTDSNQGCNQYLNVDGHVTYGDCNESYHNYGSGYEGWL